MDNQEAEALLITELEAWRERPYADLAGRVDDGPVVCERLGKEMAAYQIEIEFLWDDKRGGNVRVMGSIDDGGLRAFAPLSRSFIKSPHGAFVGE